MAVANPYLNFAGNCKEAFDFYQSIFGGEFQTVMTFADMGGEGPAPEGIAHISLPYGDSILMGSDIPAEMGTLTLGNSAYVCLTPDTVEDAEKQITALGDGGEVEMPYGKQPWGDYFGSCTDKFGIKWMVDIADPEAATAG